MSKARHDDWWHRPVWPWSRLSAWQAWLLGAVLGTVFVYGLTRFGNDHSIAPWLVLLFFSSREAIRIWRNDRKSN